MNHRRTFVTTTLLLAAACATPVEIEHPEHR
jgi:hypothetical protein